jgi:hypothetical protein
VGRRAVVSKMRSVQTTIWTKSKKFRECDAVEKLLFLFLITNPETSLCGAYEMMLDDIAHYTGIDHRNLPHVFAGLDRRGLARYEGGWVIIPNYKALYDNPKVQKGIERELSELPAHIRDSLSIDYTKPIPVTLTLTLTLTLRRRAPPPPLDTTILWTSTARQ